jgi:hypothetical protein
MASYDVASNNCQALAYHGIDTHFESPFLVEWHLMTWRTTFVRPCARHVIDMDFESTFLELNGIL